MVKPSFFQKDYNSSILFISILPPPPWALGGGRGGAYKEIYIRREREVR